MDAVLKKYIPERAVAPCVKLIKDHKVHLKIVDERITRHGDYRKLANGMHQITVNVSLNKYRFLMTLIHEIAHLAAFETYGRKIKPHGVEWKRAFQHLMIPFIRPEVYPSGILPLLANHFRNPKASSSTDARLSIALKKFDVKQSNNSYVYEIPIGSVFRIHNGKLFKKGNTIVKRIECVEVQTGRMFLFQPNAEVELIKD